MSLVERITKTAQNRGMTLADIEEHLNYPVSNTIRRWNGKNTVLYRLFEVADYLEVDARYLVKGEPTLFDLPVEHKKLFSIYEKLSSEEQTTFKHMLYSLEANVVQRIQDEKRDFIRELLKKQVDDDTIRHAARISKKELEDLKNEFEKEFKDYKANKGNTVNEEN